MKYTTTDYLRDSFWPLDIMYFLWEKVSPRLKKILKKFINWAVNIEYDEYFFRITENLPYAVLIFFLGFWFVFALARFTEKGDGIRISTISTNSMSPAILPGSVVVSSASSIYKKGDIITYKEVNISSGFPTGRALTHRIIDKYYTSEVNYITKGDSNKFPDPGAVIKNQILGRSILIIPYLGYIDIILRTLPGFLIFVAIPSFLVVRNEIAYVKKYLGVYKRITSPLSRSISHSELKESSTPTSS